MPRFRLILEDGRDAGAFTTSAPNWGQGDELYDASHNRWRVVGVRPNATLSSSFGGVLEVEPVSLREMTAKASGNGAG
jgi:hypothetical protein